MTLAVRRAATAVSALLCASSVVQAQPVHVNPDGIGQVLIYPYYTVRNGWTTLLSIVNNDSANGKAVKLRFLEGKNGALVASLNIFLAAEDVWTGAVVTGSTADQPPKLVSNDKSCTWPSFRPLQTLVAAPPPSLEFSNQAYVADGDSLALRTIDRAREGYFEVIEMASIPFDRNSQSGFTRQIYGLPAPACTAVADADLVRYAAQISGQTGGLSGSATLVNVLGGSSAEYSALAIDKFWATSAAQPAMTASTSPLPDLTSGGNLTSQVPVGGKDYFSKFNRSIDAVSAVLINEQLVGEHAFTADGTIGTTWVVASPTKRFYTQGDATAPYSQGWDGNFGVACDVTTHTSFDRDSIPRDESCGFPECPPASRPALCFAANTISFGGVASNGTDLMFGSSNAIGYRGNQNGGDDVAVPGKEGGKTRLRPSSPLARLIAASGSIASVDPVTGVVSVTTGPHTLYGLPMIGVAFNQSSFRTGNPQQNYASGFRLQSTRRITSP